MLCKGKSNNIFKKTLNLNFLDYHSHCDIVYFDYVVVYIPPTALYKLSDFITLGYITLQITIDITLV